MFKRSIQIIVALALLVTGLNSKAVAHHCPFCSAINLTFAQEMAKQDVVVIAELIKIPKPIDDIDVPTPKSSFKITQVLKGEKFVAIGMTFKTLLVGNYRVGQKFLVMGTDPPAVVWDVPTKASDRLVEYISQIKSLPEKGPERLAFFQDYFEDPESILAFDAYDEFAAASYEDLVSLKDRMDREELIGWIDDPDTAVNRRRLYFVMLGICGTEKDAEFLEELMTSGDKTKLAGLDSMIACYLNLKKGDGIDLIEETFLTAEKDGEKVDFVDTLAAVTALRFHATEVDFIPQDRIVAAVRKVLDRPKMADMIIPDLARWEDWTVKDKLVQMFEDAESTWIRVPIVNYLRACPHEDTDELIEKLRKIDPDSVRRAEFFADFEDLDFGDDDSTAEQLESAPEEAPAEDTGRDSDAQQTQQPQPPVPATGKKVGMRTAPGNTFVSASVEKVTTKKVPLPELDVSDGQSETANFEPVSALAQESTLKSVNSAGAANVSNSMVAPSLPAETAQVAPPAPPQPTPLAQNSLVETTWGVIVVPFLASGFIFALLWSVINGWFERLIF